MANIVNGFFVGGVVGSSRLAHIKVSSIVGFIGIHDASTTVYVDGGHSFSVVIKDLQLAILLKEEAEKSNSTN